MNPLLLEACAQADRLTAEAIGKSCPVQSRLSRRGTIANPAPRVLRTGEGTLSRSISLEASWFEQVKEEGGFLNFTLSKEWYAQAVKLCPEPIVRVECPPVPVPFVTKIDPEAWWFNAALSGKKAAPELAARQDSANPGWLVDYTLRRLAALEGRAPESEPWNDAHRRLFLLLCDIPDEPGNPKRLALSLEECTRAVWEAQPKTLSAVLNRYTQAVLSRREWLIPLQKIHPLPQKG